jgi:hypothetical protein
VGLAPAYSPHKTPHLPLFVFCKLYAIIQLWAKLKTKKRNNVMTLFNQILSFGQAVQASEDVDSIVKVASENGVTRNDLIVMHNLTEGNVYTGENLIKIAEDEEPSVLLDAVTAYEQLASGSIDEEQAYDMIKEAGLEVEDYNSVAECIVKQAEEAGLTGGVTAEDAVWEKVAEVYDYLNEAGIDPVAGIEFAEEFTAAEDEEAQDKVASEFDGLDEESIDKIAEAFEYLGDIEGASLSALMGEFDKEASKLDAAKKAVTEGLGKAKGTVKKLYGDVSGKNLKAAEANAKKGFFGKKKKLEAVAKAAKDTKNARIGAGIAGGTLAVGGTAAALNKEASEEILAEEGVWDKVAEAFEYLAESGLDPVTSMEFAETFSAAEDEETQDKVASEFDGLDEESIDKIAEVFEYLGDIEGVSLTSLMDEIDKEASKMEAAKKAVGKAAGKAKEGFNSYKKHVSGKGVKDAEAAVAKAGKKMFGRKKATKAAKAGLSSAKKSRNIARGATVAGGLGLAGAGAGMAHFNGRG